MTINHILILTLTGPLVACLLLLVLSGAGRKWAVRLASLPVVVMMLSAGTLVALVAQGSQPVEIALGTWISLLGSEPTDITASLYADSWSILLLSTIALTGGLIVLSAMNSSAEGEQRRLPPMLLMVFFSIAALSSGSFLMLAAAWELLSLSACWLAGASLSEPRSRSAVRRVALTLRAGSCGLWLAMALMWSSYGTVDFSQVLRVAGASEISAFKNAHLWLINAGLILWATAACAQFPLFLWVTDSAEGTPTASAMIQCVGPGAVGICTLVRCLPLLTLTPNLLLLLAIVGGFTAFTAGFIAVTQTRPQRMVAFLTAGYFGLMCAAIAAGTSAGVVAAGLLLVLHAFGNSLLCLACDSGFQSRSGSKSLIAAGVLGLSGIPPLSGFWALSAIVQVLYSQVDNSAELTMKICWSVTCGLSVASVVLSSYALVRLSHLVSLEAHTSDTAQQDPAAGATWIQMALLSLLAISALASGAAIGQPTGLLSQFLAPIFPPGANGIENSPFIYGICAAAAAVGILVGWYGPSLNRSFPAPLQRFVRPLSALSRRELFLHDFYYLCLALPLRTASLMARFMDWFLLDRLTSGLAARLPVALARFTRPAKTGLISLYTMLTVLAVSVILVLVVWSGILQQ